MTTKPFWPRIALTSTALGHLLVTSAQAHEGHDHSKRQSVDADSEVPAAESPASHDQVQTETDTAGGSASVEEPQTVEAVQPAPITSPSPSATQAGVLRPGAISLSEPLLGLIIAGPFLLMSLKKRLQS